MRLAACTYQEFQPTMGIPVRTTVGKPRFKLSYSLAGQATLLTPIRPMLQLPLDAYTLVYRRRLTAAGVDKIRAELTQFVDGDRPLVLLCFDRLDKPGNWCHRSLFADWWRKQTGELVPELGAHPPGGHTPTLFDTTSDV